MSIPFRCSSCGKEYDQPDSMAGRMASCAFCGESTRVLPSGRIGPPPVRPRGATTSLHAPDLSSLAGLEPAAAPESSPVEPPRYSMDFIAPPPKRAAVASSPAAAAARSRPALSPSPLPPPPMQTPAMPESDYIDLAMTAPPPVPTRIGSAVAMPSPHASPRATPRRKPDDDKLDDVWLLLSDDAARLVSALLLIFMLIGTVLFSRSLLSFLAEQAAVPEELTTRFGGYMMLTSGWSLVFFFAVLTPVLLGVCALACNWTKWTLPDRPYLRGAGTMTVPYLLFFGVALGLMHRQFPLVVGVMIVAPFLLVLALKELMGLRWSATLVAALLLIVAMPVAALITSPISWFVNNYALKLASLDPASIQKWMDEHPDEAARSRLKGRPIASGNGMASRVTVSSSSPPTRENATAAAAAPPIPVPSGPADPARTQSREPMFQERRRIAALARGSSPPSTLPSSPATRAKPTPEAAFARSSPTVIVPGDVKALLAVVQSDGHSSDRSAALKALAATPPAPEFRDTVAGALEQIIAADTPFITDEAADALATWQRAGTVDVMLPLLGEKVWPPSKRVRAMRVLSASGDKRAVQPIMRWVLKDTDDVVAALSNMGPVAEDEAIARLREKEPAARSAAARILSVVGTQKCVQSLRHAAGDTRDAGAASSARSALETVSARVKDMRSAAGTQPATTSAGLTPW